MIFSALIGLLVMLLSGWLAHEYRDPWEHAHPFWAKVSGIGFVLMACSLLIFAWKYLP